MDLIGHILWHLALGAVWTLVSFCAAYMAGVLAGMTRMDWSGIGLMFTVGAITFASFEIVGFALMGIFS